MLVLRALVLLPLGYLYLWPLTARILRTSAPNDTSASPASPLQIALTALAVSTGLLAVVEFWLGVLPGRWLVPTSALLVVLAGLALGLATNPGWLSPCRWLAWWRAAARHLLLLDFDALLVWTLLGIGVVITVHDLYYPFLGDDVLVRYGLQAQAIYAAHRIPESVVGYPPLIPLGIVSTWFAAGAPDEHLARLLAAVMACGTLGATYLVGRDAAGRTTGLIAAALIALTPVFVNNATLLYTDIPTAFPLTLALLYVLRWWRQDRPLDAALAGILFGIALLTKQSALMWLAGLAGLLLMRLIVSRRDHPPSTRLLRVWVTFFIPPFLIAGPWYARNALLGKEVLPVAGLYHRLAEGAGLLGLVPPLAYPQSFGWPLTPIFAVGWVAGLWLAAQQLIRVLSSADEDTPTELLVALFVVPYWLAWWVAFSFDARFLLLILPPVALWAARPMVWFVGEATERIRLPRAAWQVLGGALLLGLMFVAAERRLGGVYWTLTRPFATDVERLRHARGALIDLVLYAESNLDPSTNRLYLMDARLEYYLNGFDVATGYPQTLAELEGFDYIFYLPAMEAVYADGRLGWENSEFYRHAYDPTIFEPVYESEGIPVMRILPDGLATALGEG